MKGKLQTWQDELLRCVRTGATISGNAHPFPAQPILIVAGSCREETGDAWGTLIQRLEEKLLGFSGRVISGGTRAGVCGEIGRISSERASSQRGWTSVGYLPRSTPAGMVDDRYDEQVFTDGAIFSEIEPLQYWSDILASGILPANVTLYRYGGGALSDYEEQLAAALGANCTRFD